MSQYKWYNHFYIHFLIFEYSLKRKDWKEVFGQIKRILATIPGVLYKFGLLLNPMIAALAMSLSSVSVIFNSLRLKTKKIS